MGRSRLPAQIRRLIPAAETRAPKKPKREASNAGVLARAAEPPTILPRTAVGLADDRQVLVLDGFPTPAQVRMLGPNAGTSHRYGLSTLRSHVQGRVKVEVGVQGIRPVAPPVRVTLRYVFSDNRHRDADNFAAIGKPVIDGLVRSNVLAGDNAARLTERVEFVKEAGARRLEIVLERDQ